MTVLNDGVLRGNNMWGHLSTVTFDWSDIVGSIVVINVRKKIKKTLINAYFYEKK